MSTGNDLCIYRNDRIRARLREPALSVAAAVSALLLGTSQAKADDPLQCEEGYTGSCIVQTYGVSPGGASDSISGTLTGPATLQEFNDPSTAEHYSPLDVRTGGGQGSDGQGDKAHGEGGDGGQGGQAGSITVNIAVGTDSSTNVTGHSDGLNGVLPMTIYALGGSGGTAGKAPANQVPGEGGTGGDSGAITASLDGAWFSDTATRSVVVWSQGGTGGGGASGADLDTQGGNGGTGGNAADVNVTLNNALNQLNPSAGSWSGATHQFTGNGGILIQSIGGQGGGGGVGRDVDGSQGGQGGNGGTGGNVTVTVNANVNSSSIGSNDAGLWVLSEGGSGGNGGSGGGSGGVGGEGNDAKNVTVTFNGGTFQSGGFNSPGVLAQSLGGVGGNGGNAGSHVVGPNGGPGTHGGNAGTVSLAGTVSVTTATNLGEQAAYTYSPGILAQSIGGGGGSGADASGVFAVGGNGGNAVAGNEVSVDLTSTVTTNSYHSEGILVQSVGGGGGKAGDATGTGLGLQMVLGGSGGAGGDGGLARLVSEAGSVITTSGNHSPGLVVQSIGGGGGSGGAAYGKVGSSIFGASLALGGMGGVAGDGNAVGYGPYWQTYFDTNSGQVSTSGADSYGILGQSIGGGGGAGGASTSAAHSYGVDEYPNIALAVSFGGSGGASGKGDTVFLSNTGMISTQGAGATGILGQSIGGGGGTGGDSSSASSAIGGDYNIAASLAFGGKSGGGGDGGVVTTTSSGIILTTGESADAMLVQSVGGGGGAGGSGDAKASTNGGTTLAATLALGGSGGAGGDGHSATATNSSGAIITLGDGAVGIGAQTIGGGGGRAGGAAGSSAGGGYSASVHLGASGGDGGSTYTSESPPTVATVNNSGTVVTFGADATGILAQSIGGGGGVGGKSATGLGTKKSTGDGGNGGTDLLSVLDQAMIAFRGDPQTTINQYNKLPGAISLVQDLLSDSSAESTARLLADDDADGALDQLAQSKGQTDDDNESSSIHLDVRIGGQGGTGGDAGAVKVNNNGDVATIGHHSDGILAQAIGGGGGKGGAATTATAANNAYTGNVAVGGSGGVGGDGGEPVVTNTGTIITEGALSNGIVAQSIAGGGGIGGASASSVSTNSKNSNNPTANDGAFNSLALTIGGNGGKDGTSGQVYVTSSGSIETKAHDSIGIIAQSIAGGGGILKSMATDLEGAGGSDSGTQTIYNINLQFGGSSGSSGSSGLVNVTTQQGGTITTHGDDSYGILAQSIAGGGGLVQGGTLQGQAYSYKGFFGSGEMKGSAINDGTNSPSSGNSGVFVSVGDNITTSGAGAYGVFAQSIGGGGGVAGHTGQTSTAWETRGSTNHDGNGGYVSVKVAQGATVSTSGNYAEGIFAQSIGGGGGRFTTQSLGAMTGSAGGSGYGGPISVDVAGTVQASGAYSAGIWLQSDGDTSKPNFIANQIIVQVEQGGTVFGGAVDSSAPNLSAAIYLDHGGQLFGAQTQNEVNNNGIIAAAGTTGGDPNGTAIHSQNGYTVVTNGSTGAIVGAVDLAGGGYVTNNGTLKTTAVVASDGIVNNGVIDIRSGGETQLTAKRQLIGNAAAAPAGTPGQQARFVGNYVGNPGSTLVVGPDFSGGTSNQLIIEGSATIAGQIDVRPTTLRKNTVTLISSTGPLTLDSAVQTPVTHLFDYELASDANSVQVTPRAHFTDKAATLGHTEQAVAGSLQDVFDSGGAMDASFADLAQVRGDADYAASLRSVAGQGLGAFGAFRISSSRAFSEKLYIGCRELTSDLQTTDSCSWARVNGGSTDQDAGRDTVGYHADSYTLDVGGQVSLGEHLALVGSIGSEKSQFHGDDLNVRIKGDAAVGGVGLHYVTGHWELSGAVDAAYGWYRSTRLVTVGDDTGTANAKPRQWQVGAHMRAAYSIPFNNTLYAKPFADAHVIRVANNSFAEDGTSPVPARDRRAIRRDGVGCPGRGVWSACTSDGTGCLPSLCQRGRRVRSGCEMEHDGPFRRSTDLAEL